MPSSLRSGDPIAKDDALFNEPLALTSTSQTTSNSSAIDVDENSHLSLWQAIKKWHRVFWYSLAISSTIIMFGYDFVIVGNSSAMPAFQYAKSSAHLLFPCLLLRAFSCLRGS